MIQVIDKGEERQWHSFHLSLHVMMFFPHDFTIKLSDPLPLGEMYELSCTFLFVYVPAIKDKSEYGAVQQKHGER